MIKKYAWVFPLIIIALVAVAIATKKHNREDDLLPVNLTAIKTPVGWGYEITVDGKTYIRQEDIPAISGKEGFKSKEDALFVGREAIKKLKKGGLPTITKDELKKWKIIPEDKS